MSDSEITVPEAWQTETCLLKDLIYRPNRGPAVEIMPFLFVACQAKTFQGLGGNLRQLRYFLTRFISKLARVLRQKGVEKSNHSIHPQEAQSHGRADGLLAQGLL